jgi:hypothetical protein
MSQPTDPQRDKLEDRLMDQALREVLGGEAPPDLSDSERTTDGIYQSGTLEDSRAA